MPPVTFELKAKNEVSSSTREAKADIESLGHAAAVSSDEMALGFAKGQLSMEGLNKAIQLASQVFQSMIDNSAQLKAEMAQVSTAANTAAGSFGDALANTRQFKIAIDEAVAALRDLTEWSKGDGSTLGPLIGDALWVLGRGMEFLAWQISMTAKGFIYLTGAAKSFTDGFGPAMEEASRRADEVDATLNAAMARYDRFQQRISSGEGGDRPSAPLVDQKAAADARRELFAQVREADREEAAAARAKAAARAREAAAATQARSAELSRTAEYGRQINEQGRAQLREMYEDRGKAEEKARQQEIALAQDELARQKQQHDDKYTEAQRAADALQELKKQELQAYGDMAQGFLTSSAAAIGVAIATQGDLADAMLGVIGGSLQQLGGAMTAAGFAALAPGAAFFGLDPSLIAAGLALTAIGAGLGAYSSSGGSSGGSGGSGGTTSTSAPAPVRSTPAPAAAAASTTTVIVQGSLIRESELGRATATSQRRARRAGVTR